MEDKVGSVIPSEREIDAIVELLDTVGRRIQRYTITLSRDARVTAVRFRPGGEAIVQTVGELAEKHQVSLPKISVDAMNADLLLAQRLAPIAAALGALAQRIDDTILEARAESWWTATAYYTALARLADASPELEAALRPVIEFFATGPRGKRTGANPAAPNTPPSK